MRGSCPASMACLAVPLQMVHFLMHQGSGLEREALAGCWLVSACDAVRSQQHTFRLPLASHPLPTSARLAFGGICAVVALQSAPLPLLRPLAHWQAWPPWAAGCGFTAGGGARANGQRVMAVHRSLPPVVCFDASALGRHGCGCKGRSHPLQITEWPAGGVGLEPLATLCQGAGGKQAALAQRCRQGALASRYMCCRDAWPPPLSCVAAETGAAPQTLQCVMLCF